LVTRPLVYGKSRDKMAVLSLFYICVLDLFDMAFDASPELELYCFEISISGIFSAFFNSSSSFRETLAGGKRSDSLELGNKIFL